MAVRELGLYRTSILRIVFFYFLVVLLFRFIHYQLPFQLQNPPLFIANFDLAFWFFNYFGLKDILYQNYIGGLVFSVLLVVFNVLSIIYTKNRWFIGIFSILFFIYALGYNIYLTHSSHTFSGVILLPFCFLFFKKSNFELLWEGYRYYVCWIYLSAFLMKVYFGAFFQYNFGELTFKENIAWIIYQDPENWRSVASSFFIRNPILLIIGYYIMIPLEGLFGIGFFTKKMDKIFLLLIPFIHIVFYFFIDVLFFEQMLLSILFISTTQWKRINHFIKSPKALLNFLH